MAQMIPRVFSCISTPRLPFKLPQCHPSVSTGDNESLHRSTWELPTIRGPNTEPNRIGLWVLRIILSTHELDPPLIEQPHRECQKDCAGQLASQAGRWFDGTRCKPELWDLQTP